MVIKIIVESLVFIQLRCSRKGGDEKEKWFKQDRFSEASMRSEKSSKAKKFSFVFVPRQSAHLNVPLKSLKLINMLINLTNCLFYNQEKRECEGEEKPPKKTHEHEKLCY